MYHVFFLIPRNLCNPVVSSVFLALQQQKMARGAMGRRKRMPFRATLPLVLAACYIAREISDTFVPAPQVAGDVDAVIWAHLRLAFFVAAPLSSVGFKTTRHQTTN